MYSEICGFQKLGEISVSPKDIFSAISIARKRSERIHEVVTSSLLALDELKNQDRNNRKLLKSSVVSTTSAALDEAISSWNSFHQTVQVKSLS